MKLKPQTPEEMVEEIFDHTDLVKECHAELIRAVSNVQRYLRDIFRYTGEINTLTSDLCKRLENVPTDLKENNLPIADWRSEQDTDRIFEFSHMVEKEARLTARLAKKTLLQNKKHDNDNEKTGTDKAS